MILKEKFLFRNGGYENIIIGKLIIAKLVTVLQRWHRFRASRCHHCRACRSIAGLIPGRTAEACRSIAELVAALQSLSQHCRACRSIAEIVGVLASRCIPVSPQPWGLAAQCAVVSHWVSLGRCVLTMEADRRKLHS